MEAEEDFFKDFDGWIDLKKDMERLRKMPTVNEGEVWWCGVGTNVGVEISGKGCRFFSPSVNSEKIKSVWVYGYPAYF